MASEKKNPLALAQESRDPEAAVPATNNPGQQQHEDESGLFEKDEAMAMVGEQEHALDPAVVARAVRKIDWFLIPAMIVGCKPSPFPYSSPACIH